MPQSPPSTLPYTITTLPQRLRIKGPDDDFITVKAVPGALDTPGAPPEDGDQWYTLPLSILGSSSDKPLSCAVALKGDQLAPSKDTMVCYLKVNVKNKRSQASTNPPTLPTYYIERCSAYTIDGRATFRMCFYTETSYLISVGVVCVQDEEGVECVGYNVDQYTAVIEAVRMVELNAHTNLKLKQFEGPLASKKFQDLMTTYRKLHYQGKHGQIQEMVSEINSNVEIELDIRLFMLTEFIRNSRDTKKGEELLEMCQTPDCENGDLLQAYVAVTLSTLHSDKGDKKKSLELIHRSRSACCRAAPSYLTSQVFYCHARNLLRYHKGNVTLSVKKDILELLAHAIEDSSYGVGWERYVMYLTRIKTALFCLNGKFDLEFNSTSGYTPTAEDFTLAKQHLNAIPVKEVLENTWYAISYYIAWSDFYRLRGDTESAMKHAKLAKKVLDTHNLETAPLYKNELGKHVRSRLEYLEADPIDAIVKKFS